MRNNLPRHLGSQADLGCRFFLTLEVRKWRAPCAVQRRVYPVGERPTPLSVQPEAPVSHASEGQKVAGFAPLLAQQKAASQGPANGK